MNDLESLRKAIQDIDEKILELFEKRMHLVAEVKQVKKENNISIENLTIEKQKKEKLLAMLKDNNLKNYYEELLEKYFEIAKKYQNQ